jgi:hypothetical protein
MIRWQKLASVRIRGPVCRSTRLAAGVVWLTLLTLGPANLLAQAVTGFDIFKLQFNTQTTSAPPTSTDFWVFSARVFVDPGIGNADFSVASLAAPDGPYGGSGQSGTIFSHDENFSSEALLHAAYGSGTYDFSLQSPDLAGGTPQSGTLTVPASHFSSSTPYFTNFAAIQSINAAEDFAFIWNPFTPDLSAPEGALSQIFLSIYDHSQASQQILDAFIEDGEATTFNLVSGSLIAGHEYGATLYFSSRVPALEAWSAGADGLVSFDRATSVTFTAIPEPALEAGVISGVVGLMFVGRLARQRRAQTFGAGGRP